MITKGDFILRGSYFCEKYITYILHIYYMYITYILHIYYIYITYILHIYYIYITYILHIYYIYITYILHIYYIYITYILHIYYMYITYILHIYYIYITYILHIYSRNRYSSCNLARRMEKIPSRWCLIYKYRVLPASIVKEQPVGTFQGCVKIS